MPHKSRSSPPFPYHGGPWSEETAETVKCSLHPRPHCGTLVHSPRVSFPEAFGRPSIPQFVGENCPVCPQDALSFPQPVATKARSHKESSSLPNLFSFYILPLWAIEYPRARGRVIIVTRETKKEQGREEKKGKRIRGRWRRRQKRKRKGHQNVPAHELYL